MRATTSFGLLLAVLMMMAFAIMWETAQNEARDACTAKGGVLVTTQSNDNLCIKQDSIFK